MSYSLDARTWAEEQFESCELADKRRTRRLIEVASRMATDPSGSLPDQMESWSDLKAAYRLFDCDDVTFKAIAEPHWQRTRRRTSGRYLVINDTTQLDFGLTKKINGLAPTGNNTGRGFLLHTALMVESQTKAIVGVAGQKIHYRRPAPKFESYNQRLKRDRESQLWGAMIDAVGPPIDQVQWVHVCDRGADNFEVFCHLVEQHADWVVRASALHRVILTADGKRLALKAHLPHLMLAGTYDLTLRSRKDQPARTVNLEVRCGVIKLLVPPHKSPYLQKHRPQPIAMNVVWLREINAPKGTVPIEWVLYTSLAVATFDDAWEVIEYYESRWLVEEYHKAIKTGCRVTDRQLKDSDRLEAMMGVATIVAVRLLQLKSIANTEPDQPARRVVPLLWLTMLKAARRNLRRIHDLTVKQFYCELAKLGGFLGRTSDGNPGWVTIWRGWEKLSALVRGAELSVTSAKCG
jgi:Transposase DNA-binding/Transposase DDE domain